MRNVSKRIAAVIVGFGIQAASASPFTNVSPTGFDVTTVGASTVGGIVVQLVGANGNQVISQLAASTLFEGQPNFTPITIGTQAGFGDAVTGVLGGGLSRATFRITLQDGDNAAGNFDFNRNFFLVNGVEVANWSTVQAQNTNGLGVATASGFSGGGFRNNLLDTGWFDVTNAAHLAAIFADIDVTDGMRFGLRDAEVIGDNFFDFTLGIDNSLINIGTGPVVTPPPSGVVPEPGSLALVGLALAAAGFTRRRS
jgi:hypothetical protein